MKMMTAFRWTRTPTTPMMKSAALSASDSASTGRPPSSQHYSSPHRDEEQHARQLERQQIIAEQRLCDTPDGVELLDLLLVEIRRHDQLLRQLGAGDHHDLGQKRQSDKARRKLPAGAA